MASQVLTGNNAFSYTNNTGQNVRVIIGYLDASSPVGTQAQSINVALPGFTFIHNSSSGAIVMGKNLPHNTTGFAQVMPNEIYLSSGQTISISTTYVSGGSVISNGSVKYNILVIPEAG